MTHRRPTRRPELARFPRAKRERLRPEDVGLPSGDRRRAPGLRRQELAQLATAARLRRAPGARRRKIALCSWLDYAGTALTYTLSE